MELRSEQELANTREKLKMLEEAYEEARNDGSENACVREASMRSLKRLVNQLKEEIARYEARQPAQR
jgi:flagellar biosynthesis chaperone FliJ